MKKKYLEIDEDGKILKIYIGIKNPSDNIIEVPLLSSYKIGTSIHSYKNGNQFYDIEIINNSTQEIVPWNSLNEVPDNFIVLNDKLKQQHQFNLIRKEMEQKITERISLEIDKYNRENNLSFADINSIVKYKGLDSYLHKDFVDSILEWNMETWEYSRKVLVSVALGEREIPTWEQLEKELPIRT